MGKLDTGEQLATGAAKGLARIKQLMGDIADAQVSQADRRGNGKYHCGNQPRHHAQPEQGQGRDQVNEGRNGLHQVEQDA